jgi:hypothetical protein
MYLLLLSAYKQIYKNKENEPMQTTIDIFLKRVTPPQEETQASPSGRIPEEGIVIIEDFSSMQVNAPADPPVGQGVEVDNSDTDDPNPCRHRLMYVCFSF